jgi:hypothetical protein
MAKYARADIGPLRDTVYGIGFHWTTWTAPREGMPKSFPEAVETFDVPAFVEQAVECGAGHVMITATHADHWLPGPNPEVDRILPGRTCKRDLLMEIADALAAAGIKFMVYYNHGVHNPDWSPDHHQDPPWQEAVGSLEKDRSRYCDNYCRIVGWMSRHYGPKVIAYWFDSGYEHVKFDTPWERFTAAAKAGHDGRLICYNSGVFNFESYTPYQDYWAGEINGLAFWPLGGPLTPAGLPWYSFVTWHGTERYCRFGEWGLNMKNREKDFPPPQVDVVASYFQGFRRVGGAVTFNLFCWQDGSAYKSDLETMKALKRIVREGAEPK